MIIATAGGDCFTKAPVGIMSSGITNSSINIIWSPPQVAGSYTVQYRKSGSTTWTDAITGISTLNYNITCLDAATAYEFRVYASDSACASVIIYATTL